MLRKMKKVVRGVKMYKQHEESLRTMLRHFREQKGVIAFIFGGSVAKGMERADSDLDGMAVVI